MSPLPFGRGAGGEGGEDRTTKGRCFSPLTLTALSRRERGRFTDKAAEFADAINGCFQAKHFQERLRPQ